MKNKFKKPIMEKDKVKGWNMSEFVEGAVPYVETFFCPQCGKKSGEDYSMFIPKENFYEHVDSNWEKGSLYVDENSCGLFFFPNDDMLDEDGIRVGSIQKLFFQLREEYDKFSIGKGHEATVLFCSKDCVKKFISEHFTIKLNLK